AGRPRGSPARAGRARTDRGRAGSGRRRSCRDHLLLDADAGGDGPLDLERHGGRVLERDAGGVEDRDLLGRLATLELPADDLADLAGDVVLGDEALAERHVDLAVGDALADVVHEDAPALKQ